MRERFTESGKHMVGIKGLFETHLTVTNLERSIAFYRDALGLAVASIFPERGAAFLWIGAPGNAMLGLWSSPGVLGLHLHFAFRVTLDDLLTAPARLRQVGIQAVDFFGNPCETPTVFGWMPAASLYFSDPDGHSIELLTMLDCPARPELGVVSWEKWSAPTHRSHTSVEEEVQTETN